MDLWIRSQDKMNLCKAKDLVIRENHSGYGDTDYVIQDVYTMGTYKTKERALEVLDEISEWLDEMRYLEICMKNNQIHKSKPCVYKMPID